MKDLSDLDYKSVQGLLDQRYIDDLFRNHLKQDKISSNLQSKS